MSQEVATKLVNPEMIDSGTNALIGLTGVWGTGVVIGMLMFLVGAIIIIVYLWKVAPVRARAEIEEISKEIAAIKTTIVDLEAKISTASSVGQHPIADHSAKFKTLFYKIDALDIRVKKIEGTCQERLIALNNIQTNVGIVNSSLPKLIDSIGQLDKRVWEIARDKGGK